MGLDTSGSGAVVNGYESSPSSYFEMMDLGEPLRGRGGPRISVRTLLPSLRVTSKERGPHLWLLPGNHCPWPKIPHQYSIIHCQIRCLFCHVPFLSVFVAVNMVHIRMETIPIESVVVGPSASLQVTILQ